VGEPAKCGPSILHVLQGAEAHERSWLVATGWLGLTCSSFRRRRNSREDAAGGLTVAGGVFCGKTTQPRKWPNGKVGSHNQTLRYFTRLNTLNE
jgi:hypothetical protein